MKKCFLFIFLSYMLFAVLFGNQNKYPLDTAYHNEKEIAGQIRTWQKNYPKLFSSQIIGYSNNEAKPIRSFKISKTPKAKDPNKAAILFVGQIHSEEPMGVEILISLADNILRKYKNGDPEIKNLLNHFELHFIPTINPEGFAVVNNGIYYNQRKNKTDTNNNGKFNPGYDGVDINRNFPINWNNEEQFKPTDRYYAGKAPASESETKAVMDFIKRENFYFAFNYHSSIMGEYNEKIYYPWYWKNGKSPHWYEMRNVAVILAKNLKKDYLNDNYVIHEAYTSKVGFLRDWAYSEIGTFFYDIEVGGIYKNKSIVFPKNELLYSIIDKHLNAMFLTLSHIQNNTLKLILVNKQKQVLTNQPVSYYNLINKYVKPKKSNNKGIVYLFIPPDKDHFSIFVNKKKYKIKLTDMNRSEYILTID